jgi:effector-binding domain-containing protein
MTNAVDRPDAPPSEQVRIVELPERSAIVVRFTAGTAEFPSLVADAFRRTAEAIRRAGAAFGGPPFARYYNFGERIDAEAGFPYQGTIEPTTDLVLTTLPAGRAVTTQHVGGYEQIGEAWDRAGAWMRSFDVEASAAPWECYLTGPDEPGPPVTEIFFPIG